MTLHFNKNTEKSKRRLLRKNSTTAERILWKYLKARRFLDKKFRRQYLNLSLVYSSFKSLAKNPPQHDIYICGSDQIWNPSFTGFGEGHLTLSYFLNYGASNVKRIAYAVSFGCMEYPEGILKKIIPSLIKFNAISVREYSGRNILQRAGLDNIALMPDPTLLLKAPCV